MSDFVRKVSLKFDASTAMVTMTGVVDSNAAYEAAKDQAAAELDARLQAAVREQVDLTSAWSVATKRLDDAHKALRSSERLLATARIAHAELLDAGATDAKALQKLDAAKKRVDDLVAAHDQAAAGLGQLEAVADAARKTVERTFRDLSESTGAQLESEHGERVMELSKQVRNAFAEHVGPILREWQIERNIASTIAGEGARAAGEGSSGLSLRARRLLDEVLAQAKPAAKELANVA
jgi:hypothetical protein